MSESLAESLLGIVIRSNPACGLEEDLKSKISGLEELKIILFDRDANVCLETSNLLAADNGCTIALTLLEPHRGDSNKHAPTRSTIGDHELTQLCIKRLPGVDSLHSDIGIPLAHPGTSTSFGSLIARVKCAETGLPNPQSIKGISELAYALNMDYSHRLCDFMSLVTSLLLNPSAAMAANQEGAACPHAYQPEESRTGTFSIALAPLCTSLPLPSHLPIVGLFTLEFQETALEHEYQSWKARCMKKLDVCSFLACSLFIAADFPCSALNQALAAACIMAIAAATIGLAQRMPKALELYRDHRDKVLIVAMLLMACVVHVGGASVWRTHRLFTLVSLFLPVRLRWHAPGLLVAGGWGAVHLAIGASSSLQLTHELICLVIGGLVAPSVLLYIMEVISRRAFVSRQAILAAEEAEADGEEWWLEDDEDLDLEDDYDYDYDDDDYD